MIFILLTFLAALALAAVSGWFSIVGFMAIYAGAPMYALIMGVVVECAKLVTTSWLYRNAKTASWKLKAPLYYFTIALMAATSIGVFGFLSKAHLEQGAGTIDNGPKIERLNYQIEREKSLIADNEKVIKQLDDTVNSFLGKDRTDRSLAVRKSQAPQRKQLREDIDASQKRIDQLSEEKLKLDSEVRKMQLEVGPIRYIAELVYGVQEDSGKNVEAAVRMFTLLIVSTLDPLAIALLIAANHSLAHWRRKDEKEVDLQANSVESEALGTEILSEEGSPVRSELTGFNNSFNETTSLQGKEIINETPETAEESIIVEVSEDATGGIRDVSKESAEMVDEVQGSNEEHATTEMAVLKGTDAEEKEDTTHSDTSGSEDIRPIGETTVAVAIAEEEEDMEPLLEEHHVDIETAGLEGEVPDQEAPHESIIEFLKPSWEQETVPVVTKETKPWAQQDSVLRELLGPHFTPTKVNEKEKATEITSGEKSNQYSEITEPTILSNQEDKETSQIQEMEASTSVQDQAPQILQEFNNREAGGKASDKYPKALSWLNEFKRD